MHPKTLRFYAVGDGMVPDLAAQTRGMRRFHGRKLTVDPGLGVARHNWGVRDARGVEIHPTPSHAHFAHTNEVIELPCSEGNALAPHVHDYAKFAREGHLRPADEATARFCGLPWAPADPPMPAASHPEIHDEKPGTAAVEEH